LHDILEGGSDPEQLTQQPLNCLASRFFLTELASTFARCKWLTQRMLWPLCSSGKGSAPVATNVGNMKQSGRLLTLYLRWRAIVAALMLAIQLAVSAPPVTDKGDVRFCFLCPEQGGFRTYREIET